VLVCGRMNLPDAVSPNVISHAKSRRHYRLMYTVHYITYIVLTSRLKALAVNGVGLRPICWLNWKGLIVAGSNRSERDSAVFFCLLRLVGKKLHHSVVGLPVCAPYS